MQSKKILFIEDDEITREYITNYAMKINPDLHAFSTGSAIDALNIAKNNYI